MKAVLLLCFLGSALAAVVTPHNVNAAFKFTKFTVDFNKHYETTAEYDHAFHNFQATLKRLADREARGIKGYGITKFADLSPEEFRAKYLLPKGMVAANVEKMKQKFAVNKGSRLPGPPPAKFNWVDQGATTPVKDQQDCGSCWAFSTTENFESMNYIAGHGLEVLAPQQLVDCDPQSQGCGGGWTYWAFEYLMNATGQETELNYPYTAQDGTCMFDPTKIAAKLTNFTFATATCQQSSCPVQDDLLRKQLYAVGPLSICVNAGTWSDWTGPEPMTSADCPGDGDALDHCVQLVGYDWTQKYWIVRNSWNTSWGQEGFIFLETGGNTCGLADVVTYANVTKSANGGKHPHRHLLHQ